MDTQRVFGPVFTETKAFTVRRNERAEENEITQQTNRHAGTTTMPLPTI